HDLAILLSDPAALPAVLIFPILRVSDARLGLDIVEPCVFNAFAVGPYVLAGDRAGMAADALVEVQNHRDLRADLHGTTSVVVADLRPVPQSAVACPLALSSAALSNQFISLILRMIT